MSRAFSALVLLGCLSWGYAVIDPSGSMSRFTPRWYKSRRWRFMKSGRASLQLVAALIHSMRCTKVIDRAKLGTS